MKPQIVLFLAALALFTSARAISAGDTGEELLGQYRGEWRSYTRGIVKMELEITSVSPLEGVLYVTRPAPSERSRFADVKGNIKNGKISLEFVGPDGAAWNFKLSLKGRVLEGEGQGLSPWFHVPAVVNLRLEKVD